MARTSTMKGKQSVSYRYFSDEGLEAFINLPNTVQKLLFKIIKDSDKKDNCCRLNPQQLIAKHGLNQSNTYTHLRKLKSVNFLRDVEDIYGTTRLMVNPEWASWQSRDLVRFTILMYSLGSHELTLKHLGLEEKCRGRIDIYTGEHFDWFRNGLEKANCHYGLPANTGYEYVSTDIVTSKKATQVLPTSSMNTGNTDNQAPYSFEECTDYEKDNNEAFDDYADSYQFKGNTPAMLSFKDVRARMT